MYSIDPGKDDATSTVHIASPAVHCLSKDLATGG